MNDLQSLMEVIRFGRKTLLCGHVMPDGDSLGSVLALGAILGEMGKEVTMTSFDPVPENLAFLPGAEYLVTGEQRCSEHDHDTLVMLDCSAPDRLGPYAEMLGRNLLTVNIDHHPGNTLKACYNYVDPAASATGEIIFDMLAGSGLSISPPVAVCLYTAIITDTGSFRYENTTPGTHRRVADLMECGINTGHLNELIYDQKPVSSILLLRGALQTLEFSPCGKVAWITVLKRALQESGAKDEDAEGIINYPRSIKGVEVAILFRELEPGAFKVGFRSKGKVDVNGLAGRFGGGGHKKASGCLLEGKLQGIRRQVVDAALETVRERDGVSVS